MVTMEIVLVFIYLFIGIVYAVCSACTKVSVDKETEKIYRQVFSKKLPMLYMLIVMYFWPVFVTFDIFKK